MDTVLLRIEGEMVGWDDLRAMLFLIYIKSTSHCSWFYELSLAETGEFIPAMKLL